MSLGKRTMLENPSFLKKKAVIIAFAEIFIFYRTVTKF